MFQQITMTLLNTSSDNCDAININFTIGGKKNIPTLPLPSHGGKKYL